MSNVLRLSELSSDYDPGHPNRGRWEKLYYLVVKTGLEWFDFKKIGSTGLEWFDFKKNRI